MNVHVDAYGVKLPPINSYAVGAKLLFGAAVRNTILTTAFYGVRSELSQLVRKNKDSSTDDFKKNTERYLKSFFAEAGISLLLIPFRYTAAIHAQRSLFDFLFPGASDAVSVLDRFWPSEFMTFSLFAFASLQNGESNWDYFLWQLPSVALNLGKLFWRRRAFGAENCRTKRIMAMIGLQVVVRSFVASFSVNLPQIEGEVVVGLVMMLLESLATHYIYRFTWPFAL